MNKETSKSKNKLGVVDAESIDLNVDSDGKIIVRSGEIPEIFRGMYYEIFRGIPQNPEPEETDEVSN